MDREYKIDYEMFNALEVVKIIEFFQLIEKTKHQKIKKELLIEKYREYQSILRNKALEKEYDKMLYDMCGVSIYKVMKEVLNK